MALHMKKFSMTAAFTLTAVVALLAGSSLSYAQSTPPETISVVDEDNLTPPATDAAASDPAMGAVTDEAGTAAAQPVPAAVENPAVPMQTAPAVSDAGAPNPGLLPPAAALPEADTGELQGTNVMGDTGARSTHSGQYYDSNALVPDSQLESAGVTGPRKVDPLYEPGQKFVTVTRGGSAVSFEGQYVAATRALKLGRYAAAMEMFEKLYKKSPRDARILMGLAVAQQGAGFVESASRTYEDLLQIDPDNADAIVNLMGIMRTQYPAVTLQNLKELRNKYPTNPGIPAQIGLVSAEMKNYDEAIQYLEVAASMDPQNPNHIYNMAIITDRKGDMKGAIPLYERALQLDSSYGDTARALPREEIYDRLATLRRKV